MATRRPTTPSLVITPKEFTDISEIDRAITKLGRRLDEISGLDPKQITFDDQEVRNIENRVRDTILEVFGPNSPEHYRHARFQIAPGIYGALNCTKAEAQREFPQGIVDACSVVKNIIKTLEEKRGDFGQGSAKRVHDAFAGLELHPRIASVGVDLFNNGHYRNAVLDASVALVNLVKEKSRRHDLDGADLMRTVFSKNKPVLAFNDLRDQSELDEQEGLMHLFEGAVLALRNPRAHELTPDSPEEALEFIALLSLLAKKVDGAQRR